MGPETSHDHDSSGIGTSLPGDKLKGGHWLTWDSRVKRDITECGLLGVNPSDRNCWRERVRATRVAIFEALDLGGIEPSEKEDAPKEFYNSIEEKANNKA